MDRLNFKTWFESIALSAAKKVHRGLVAKKYKPGTFGIEIELRIPVDQKEVLRKLRNIYGFDEEIQDELEQKARTGHWIDDLEDYHIKIENEEIDRWIDIIQGFGEESDYGPATRTAWGVSDDGPLVCEIRSKWLTTKDIPVLLKILNKLSGSKFDGNTSAHIHIGLPEDTNGFDLLALTTLADEEAIKKDAGANRGFDKWADFNKNLHNSFLEKLKEDGLENSIMEDGELKDILWNFDRDFGTNTTSFFTHGTIEFRYLSSQIVEHPYNFIKWIQYFLMLPRIARTRNQIRIKDLGGKDYYFARLAGGRIQISAKPVSMTGDKPENLRNYAKNVPKQVNIKDRSLWDIINRIHDDNALNSILKFYLHRPQQLIFDLHNNKVDELTKNYLKNTLIKQAWHNLDSIAKNYLRSIK